jgi:hypothetical protein
MSAKLRSVMWRQTYIATWRAHISVGRNDVHPFPHDGTPRHGAATASPFCGICCHPDARHSRGDAAQGAGRPCHRRSVATVGFPPEP